MNEYDYDDNEQFEVFDDESDGNDQEYWDFG